MPDDSKSVRAALREDIASLREAGQPDTPTPELTHLIESAERVGALADSMFGSCELGRPYADMFLVARGDGALVWRCAHDPAHPDIEARA